MKIFVADRHGNLIEEVKAIKEGLNLIDKFEQEDKENGNYEEGFYEVCNELHETLVL